MRITDRTTLGELAGILSTMGIRSLHIQSIPPEGNNKTLQWSAVLQHGPRGRQYDGGYDTHLERTINEAASQLGLAIATNNQDK